MTYRKTNYARAALMAALVAASAGCSFVQMAPGGEDVRVVGEGQLPAGCVKRGEVEVSVKNSLGPYERNEMRVKDELEVLARNEAPGLGADTVQPKGPPLDGAQRFLAFKCGPGAAAAPAARDEAPRAEAETAPLKDE
jgi:hypothetical protein